jgi:4-hydroxybenzoate polyprenyltransferase
VGRLRARPDLDLAAEDGDLEVIRHARLFATMLRFRVAAMVWLFMLLGAAFHSGLGGAPWRPLLAAVALGACYVAATALNDVADEPLDRVNHPRGAGRPLVSGEATPRELRSLAVVAGGGAAFAAVPLGRGALVLVGVSLAIAHAYSLPPLRFSYRTYLAPLVLGIGYVLVPYLLGVAVAGSAPAARDVSFAAGLYALFVARIVLKDFRDREGDALYGRPTLLLRFGKDATCAVSGVALAAGVATLVAVVPSLAPVLAGLAAAIAWMLLRLRRAEERRDEQVAIGIGARMGNGLLTCVLAWLVLDAAGAAAGERLFFVLLLAGLFAASFVALVRRPDVVVIGYKG